MKVLHSFSIKALILTNALILIGFLILCSSYAIVSMSKINGELTNISTVDIPLTENVTAVTEHQLEQGIHFERALRYAEKGPSAANKVDKEIKYFDKLGKKVEEEIHISEGLVEKLLSKATSEKDYAEAEHMLEALKAVEKEHRGFEDHAHQAFTLLKEHKTTGLEALVEQIEREEDKLTKELEALVNEISAFTEYAAQLAQSHQRDALGVLIVLIIVSVAVGLSMSLFISHLVRHQIGREPRELNEIARSIAEGDLGIELPDIDKATGVYASIAEMLESLKSLIAGIRSGVEKVTDSSEALATTSENTNQSIEALDNNTDQIAVAVTEMSAAVEEVAKNSTTAADAAVDANSQAQSSQALVEDTAQNVEGLSKQLTDTMATIGKLAQEASDITGILDVIKGIADQTNLLALNAAIEAARAGEQGRGFAVVADEVRALAKSTQESTSEIETMIKCLQSSATESIESMRCGSEQALDVLSQTEKVTDALGHVQESVSSISEMNTQIAVAVEEQTAVANDINRNISTVSLSAKETNDSSREMAKTSEDLAGLAVKLQQSVSSFRL